MTTPDVTTPTATPTTTATATLTPLPTVTLTPPATPVFDHPVYLPLVRKGGAGDETWDERFGSGVTYVPSPGFSPIPGTIYAVAISQNGQVYVGGSFNEAGGQPANNIARWDGAEWSALGAGAANTVRALALKGNEVYVGGDFTSAGGIAANHVAKWDSDTGAWSALGSGINGPVYALAVNGNTVYAGGAFTAAGAVAAENVARWDGANWSKLGVGLDFVLGRTYALAVSGNRVAVGGDFIYVDVGSNLTTVNGLVIWDSATDTWYPVGNAPSFGVRGSVFALAFSGDQLYVGGKFDRAGEASANAIARWSGATWSALGSGVGGARGGAISPEVSTLAVMGNQVYAGGDFSVAGNAQANAIARWDTLANTWSPLGSGLSDPTSTTVNALVAGNSGLYVGGYFTLAGSHPASSFARWGTPPD